MVTNLPRSLERPARAAWRAKIRLAERVAPLIGRLPGDSTSFGPPRRYSQTMASWVSQRADVAFRVVDPPRLIDHPRPAIPSDRLSEGLLGRYPGTTFATWVATIPSGRVVGEDPTVVGPDDTVFGELHNMWPQTVGYQRLALRARLPRPTRVAGRVGVAGVFLGNNYFHWVIDVIPRLRLLAEDLATLDHLVVPHHARYQREFLEAAGVPMDRLIEPSADMHLVADELVVPSLVPRGDPTHLDFVHDLVLQGEDLAPSRRLYVTRANQARRRVLNEVELIAALAPRGFETVVMDGLSVAEQARLFAEASVVLGPNGGALANMVFAQPGCILIELADANYTIPDFWEITAARGGTYHCFLSESSAIGSQWADVKAPIDKICAALDAHGLA